MPPTRGTQPAVSIERLVEIAGSLIDRRNDATTEFGRLRPVTIAMVQDAVQRETGGLHRGDPGRCGRALRVAQALRGAGAAPDLLNDPRLSAAERTAYEQLLATMETRPAQSSPDDGEPDLPESMLATIEQIGALVRQSYRQGLRALRDEERARATATIAALQQECDERVTSFRRAAEEARDAEEDATTRANAAESRAAELKAAVELLGERIPALETQLTTSERHLREVQEDSAQARRAAADVSAREAERRRELENRAIAAEQMSADAELRIETLQQALRDARDIESGRVAALHAAHERVLNERGSLLSEVLRQRDELQSRVRELEQRFFPAPSRHDVENGGSPELKESA